MKILIVSGCFYPEVSPRSFRTTELAKELSRSGNDVTVVAPMGDCDYSPLTQGANIRLVKLERHAKCIRQGHSRCVNIGIRVINRLSNLLFEYPTSEFYFNVPKAIEQNLKGERFDLLISIAMPHSIHWGTNRIMKKYPEIAKVWIADCGDPFMGCKTDTFKKMFYFKYVEKAFCRRCDFITVPIKDAIPSYYPEFHGKIRVIPQGFDFSEDLETDPKEPSNKVPTFVFAGSFIPDKRDPRPLLEWLCKYKGDFRFYIFTTSFNLVSSYKSKLGDKLQLQHYVPRTELLPFMKRCDFLLNIENGTAAQSPSKLIDYALCKRPILSINSNNMDYDKISEFIDGNYARQLKAPDISQYDIRNVARQFIDLYECAK